MVTSVSFTLHERDILKTILEFLEIRGLHITQVSYGFLDSKNIFQLYYFKNLCNTNIVTINFQIET